MTLRIQKKKHNRTYYENNCVDSMQLENKEVCPLCRVQPQRILECVTREGKIVFYKQCQSCLNIVRIERYSAEL